MKIRKAQVLLQRPVYSFKRTQGRGSQRPKVKVLVEAKPSSKMYKVKRISMMSTIQRSRMTARRRHMPK